jgi:hypothetical protein
LSPVGQAHEVSRRLREIKLRTQRPGCVATGEGEHGEQQAIAADEQPVELQDDLERNPGIGSSKGLFARFGGEDESLIEGDNRFEGDTDNDGGAAGGVNRSSAVRTNRHARTAARSSLAVVVPRHRRGISAALRLSPPEILTKRLRQAFLAILVRLGHGREVSRDHGLAASCLDIGWAARP